MIIIIITTTVIIIATVTMATSIIIITIIIIVIFVIDLLLGILLGDPELPSLLLETSPKASSTSLFSLQLLLVNLKNVLIIMKSMKTLKMK